jgi:vancomycin resistance protein YoaR
VAENAANVRFSLTLIKSPPAVSTESLDGIDAIVGQYVTRFDPGLAGRTHNLRLGVRMIDGRILQPGEVFSLNDTIGERTPERGFQKATIFVGGKMVEGYGGGISQVTGTLFNAALEAGLEIVTYRVHSRPVAYLPHGRDATVAWGSFDMMFRNSTAHPIYIDYRAPGNRCVATLFGHGRPGWNVKIETKVERLGERHIIADLYRTIDPPDGEPKRIRLGRSVYQWPADEPEPEPATAD